MSSKADTPLGNGDLIKPRMADEGSYFMTCCDCSLVHRLDFTLNSNVPVDPREIRLELRVYRDDQKTKAARAQMPNGKKLGRLIEGKS
jgi:hypothetical protein